MQKFKYWMQQIEAIKTGSTAIHLTACEKIMGPLVFDRVGVPSLKGTKNQHMQLPPPQYHPLINVGV